MILAAALLACAPKQAVDVTPSEPPSPQPPPVEQPTPDHTRLYERLEEARLMYEEGVELLIAGEEVLGEARIAFASTELRTAADECATAEGCELNHFLDAIEALMSLQSMALKQQALQIGTLESTAEEDLEREPGTSPFVTVIPEIGRTESLLRGTDLSEIITLNAPVNAALDDWLTWMRPMLMEAYENYQFLRDEIAPIYEEAGLPEALLFAMIATETGGKVHSYSRAGAAGPLQFMRHTGRRYGLTIVDGFDTRLDPVAATKANVAYLNDQFKVLNDNLEKALAAYNGGENRMRTLQRRYGDMSLWDSRVYYSLPTETREYVPRILAAAWLFLHPEDYNLQLGTYETEKTRLVLERELSLGELTICLGQEQNRDGWFRTLRNLNPRLNPGERIEVGKEIVIPAFLEPVYRERCLEGELIERAGALYDANYPDGSELIVYHVRRGDTLARIAKRHGGCSSIREIAALNGVRPPRYVIRIGQTLKIPPCN
jgi:membrane-bound lytic murein transglycosylase D